MKFEPSELKAFDLFFFRLVKASAETDLVLFIEPPHLPNYEITQPYSMSVIALEIKQRTKFGRACLDRIKEMRLI